MNILLGLVLATTPTHTPASRVEVVQQKIPGSLVGFDMAKTPGGSVTVDGKKYDIKPLWVSTTEVTWDMYDIWLFRLDLTKEEQTDGTDAKSRPSKPYLPPDYGYGHKGFAAICITHNAANMFCAWLSKKTGRTYRLPTEAEWVYLAQAGSDKLPAKMTDVGWFADNADEKAHAVGKKLPNAWGLYDVFGNAAEWVNTTDGREIVCGGSFHDSAADVNFLTRQPYSIEWQERDPQIPKSKWWLSDADFPGFRLVCEEAPSKD